MASRGAGAGQAAFERLRQRLAGRGTSPPGTARVAGALRGLRRGRPRRRPDRPAVRAALEASFADRGLAAPFTLTPDWPAWTAAGVEGLCFKRLRSGHGPQRNPGHRQHRHPVRRKRPPEYPERALTVHHEAGAHQYRAAVGAWCMPCGSRSTPPPCSAHRCGAHRWWLRGIPGAPGPAGYGHVAVPPGRLPHPPAHGQGRHLPVPWTGDRAAAHLEVSGLGAVWPHGGYVGHGQAQDLDFVRSAEQGNRAACRVAAHGPAYVWIIPSLVPVGRLDLCIPDSPDAGVEPPGS
jgi:hypothetical protein